MIGRTNAGGGGTGATLTVNAPAGFSVIVTNPTTGRTYTRTANSNGVAMFKGLPTGTWTVTRTNGTQHTTITVVVTADYAIDFSEQALYADGNEFNDITGGWVKFVPTGWHESGLASEKKETTIFIERIKGSASTLAWPAAGFQTGKAVNINAGKTLRVTGSVSGSPGVDTCIYLCASRNKISDIAESDAYSKKLLEVSETFYVELDISKLSQSLYIGFIVTDNIDHVEKFSVSIDRLEVASW